MLFTNYLEPGGYLQWDEMDPEALNYLPRPVETPMICLEELARIWKFTNPIGYIQVFLTFSAFNG